MHRSILATPCKSIEFGSLSRFLPGNSPVAIPAEVGRSYPLNPGPLGTSRAMSSIEARLFRYNLELGNPVNREKVCIPENSENIETGSILSDVSKYTLGIISYAGARSSKSSTTSSSPVEGSGASSFCAEGPVAHSSFAEGPAASFSTERSAPRRTPAGELASETKQKTNKPEKTLCGCFPNNLTEEQRQALHEVEKVHQAEIEARKKARREERGDSAHEEAGSDLLKTIKIGSSNSFQDTIKVYAIFQQLSGKVKLLFARKQNQQPSFVTSPKRLVSSDGCSALSSRNSSAFRGDLVLTSATTFRHSAIPPEESNRFLQETQAKDIFKNILRTNELLTKELFPQQRPEYLQEDSFLKDFLKDSSKLEKFCSHDKTKKILERMGYNIEEYKVDLTGGTILLEGKYAENLHRVDSSPKAPKNSLESKGQTTSQGFSAASTSQGVLAASTSQSIPATKSPVKSIFSANELGLLENVYLKPVDVTILDDVLSLFKELTEALASAS